MVACDSWAEVDRDLSIRDQVLGVATVVAMIHDDGHRTRCSVVVGVQVLNGVDRVDRDDRSRLAVSEAVEQLVEVDFHNRIRG